mmetsp:Transcript_33184/g.83951  ORF Transcript_33184/g.83951 Transcript_33184/m.83951 type:complete len:95 (-) Transcript_33184:241-525(-)
MSAASWDLQSIQRAVLSAMLLLLVLFAEALAQEGSEEEGTMEDEGDGDVRGARLARVGKLAVIVLPICGVGCCCGGGAIWFWRRRQRQGTSAQS